MFKILLETVSSSFDLNLISSTVLPLS